MKGSVLDKSEVHARAPLERGGLILAVWRCFESRPLGRKALVGHSWSDWSATL